MLKEFSHKINDLKDFALAVSGGADSLCMTLLCHQLGLKPIVLIVDHKLREESSAEALYVKHYIEQKFNFEVNILTWDKDIMITSNIQSKARDARYILLTNESRRLGIPVLCTAHNQNDQAETVFMNIMRGTGIDGLVGIRDSVAFDSIDVIRPMLSFTRDEIENYLTLYGIDWVNDPSNEIDKYERVKIRRLIKLISNSNLVNGEHFISRLNLLSNNAIRAQGFIDKYVEKKIQDICNFWHLNIITIDLAQLILEDEEVVLRILRILVKTIGLQKYYVRSKSLTRLYNDLLNINKVFYRTLGQCFIWNGWKKNKCILVIAKEMVNCQHIIPQNEAKELELALYESKPEYIVYNHDIYYKAQQMVENIPGIRYILSSIAYEFVDGKKLYPSLGIARLLN